jgi:hypothetical protein
LHDVRIEPGTQAQPAEAVTQDRAFMRGKRNKRFASKFPEVDIFP